MGRDQAIEALDDRIDRVSAVVDRLDGRLAQHEAWHRDLLVSGRAQAGMRVMAGWMLAAALLSAVAAVAMAWMTWRAHG